MEVERPIYLSSVKVQKSSHKLLINLPKRVVESLSLEKGQVLHIFLVSESAILVSKTMEPGISFSSIGSKEYQELKEMVSKYRNLVSIAQGVLSTLLNIFNKYFPLLPVSAKKKLLQELGGKEGVERLLNNIKLIQEVRL